MPSEQKEPGMSRSQRVVKPGVKKRRPPLACIPCYQRKLKCGKELPSCSRCLRTGNAGSCIYRRDANLSSAADGMTSDVSPRNAHFVANLDASVTTVGPPQGDPTLSNSNGDMTHLKWHENITKFYGYTYPLNLYQKVFLIMSSDEESAFADQR